MLGINSLHASRIHPRRVEVLSRRLAEWLPPCAHVLDVGCGDGMLASRLLETCPDLTIRGLDVLVRPETRIPVQEFDGKRFPVETGAVDCVLFVDVLHHTTEPLKLLFEARRVAWQSLLIKDHLREVVAARATMRFMDRVGNARHGVALPYNYLSREEWREAFRASGFTIEEWSEKVGLYPWPLDLVFGRSLHFLAKLGSDKIEGERGAGVAALPPAP